MNPLLKKSAILGIIIIVIDQAVKFWVKTHMYIGESSYTDWGWGISWFQLNFSENAGFSFGMKLPGKAGKVALVIFRYVAIGMLIWYICSLCRKNKAHKMFIYCLSLITSGAIGNLIDCTFYGVLFSQTGYIESTVASFLPAEGGYAPLFFGKVVDMLQFPLVEWQWPDWMPFCGGNSFVFFSPVFNVADSAITIGVFTLIIFHKRIFPSELLEPKATDESKGKEGENIENADAPEQLMK